MQQPLKKIASFVLILALSAACKTYDPYTGEEKVSSATKGAVGGAVAGAVIGGATGGTEGALIGAAAGGAVGGGIGYYVDQQEAKLRHQLQGTGVSVTRDGNNIWLNMPGDITFDVDQSGIKGSFMPVLDSVAIVLKEFKKSNVHVLGFTDSTGSFEYNQSLSERRASSVASYLQSQGVDRNRLHIQGMGPRNPVASNDTKSGRSLNRRVEIQIINYQ